MKTPSEADRAWLAGLLEGEGSFGILEGARVRPWISLQMTDEDVVSRVASMFEVAYCQPTKQEKHHKQSYKLMARGARAQEIMRWILPFMGARRTAAISKALDGWTPPPPLPSRDEVVALRKKNLTWRQIGTKLSCNHETVRRIYKKIR